MVEDSERLDKLMEAGVLRRPVLEQGLEQTRHLVAQLESAPDAQEGIQLLALKQARLRLQLYEALLLMTNTRGMTRAEKAGAALERSQVMRTYLEQSIEVEQNFDVMPVNPMALGLAGSSTQTEVALLPPPTAARLNEALAAHRHAQVIREVEAAGPDVVARMTPEAVAAYALALGAQGRYLEATKVAEAVPPPEVLLPASTELRYQSALWLIREGKSEAGLKSLRGLHHRLKERGKVSRRFERKVQDTLADVARSSAPFARALVDARLVLARGDYPAARDAVTTLLERESAASAIERLEALLAEIDRMEEATFQRDLTRLRGLLADSSRLDLTQELLESMGAQYPERRYRTRLEGISARVNGLQQQRETGGLRRVVGPTSSSAVIEGVFDEETGAPMGKSGDVVTASKVEMGAEAGSAVVPKNEGTDAVRTKTNSRTPADIPREGAAAGVATGSGDAEEAPTPLQDLEEEGQLRAREAADGAGHLLEREAADGDGRALKTAAPSEPLEEETEVEPTQPATPAPWEVALTEGKKLVTSGKYEAAVEMLEALADTPAAEEAATWRLKAIDQLVQRVREKVAKEYVRAQRLRSKEEKRQVLTEIHAQLKTALELYPETSLRAKAEHNLTVLRAELDKLGPPPAVSPPAAPPEASSLEDDAP